MNQAPPLAVIWQARIEPAALRPGRGRPRRRGSMAGSAFTGWICVHASLSRDLTFHPPPATPVWSYQLAAAAISRPASGNISDSGWPANPAGRSARTVAVMKTTRAAAGRRHLAGSPFNVPFVEEPVETYERDDLVTHDKYGLGSVIGVDGQASVLVDFGMERVRVALPCGMLYKL